MLLKGYGSPDHRGDLKDTLLARFVTSDGSEITSSQWNSTLGKGAPVTGSTLR
jgi:hypothetical protein